MRRSDPPGARGPARPGAVRRAGIGVGAALLTLLTFSPSASAFCRTSVCPKVGTASVCTPAQRTDCGIPLFWPSPCVSYSIQEDASQSVSLAETEAIFATAFSAWTNAACGPDGQTPRMRVDATDPVECAVHEYNQKKGNANVIVFRDDLWPYPGGASTLALTTVTYNLDNGEIYDADMELNSFDQRFVLGEEPIKADEADLLSIVTHETGHFLGLSHSAEGDATMFSTYPPKSITLRNLSDDDVEGICTIYPPGAPIDGCDSTPRHGFSSLAAADQPDAEDEAADGCSVAAPGGERRSATRVDPRGLAAIALLGAALRRHRSAARRGARRAAAAAATPREADQARAS